MRPTQGWVFSYSHRIFDITHEYLWMTVSLRCQLAPQLFFWVMKNRFDKSIWSIKSYNFFPSLCIGQISIILVLWTEVILALEGLIQGLFIYNVTSRQLLLFWLSSLSFLMNSIMTGFRWLSKVFASLSFGQKLASALEGLKQGLFSYNVTSRQIACWLSPLPVTNGLSK